MEKTANFIQKVKETGKKHLGFIKELFQKFGDNDPFRLAAVVSYFAIFSLPGLLIIVIKSAGFFFGEETISQEIFLQVKNLIGKEGASQIQTMVNKAGNQENSKMATIIGIGSIVYAATGLFYHIKISLNQIWEIKEVPRKPWLQLIIDRTASFGLILVMGFLLIISLVVSSLIALIGNNLSQFGLEQGMILLQIINFMVSMVITSLLFASIFKWLPDAIIRWKDAIIGAVFTTILFEIGKELISYYLGTSDPGSTYGAAGSVVIILLWVTYTSIIFFFGAVFTQVYSKWFGREIKPEVAQKKKNKVNVSKPFHTSFQNV
ncbi:YihY/virulence factor BrkB family protein [Flexithrix dorotheae]|uniref:YihY/virulence factor BrkB family protein n=1 Tax=Flexithrix dorotheae TaxID=70993 RepID=UPI00146C191C|nr:YihY/virulence factor BrkB family protein [Flexithrix dorotheae]